MNPNVSAKAGLPLWSPSDETRPIADGRMRLFALETTSELGLAVAERLSFELNAHEERGFEDGEHKIRPLDDVRGADVYVLHSLAGGPSQSANDKLCRLLFFIGALKDAGAASTRTFSSSRHMASSATNSRAECFGYFACRH